MVQAQDSLQADLRWDDRFASSYYMNSSTVYSTAVFDGQLYIGGDIRGISYGDNTDVTLKYLLRWDGQEYQAITDTLTDDYFELETVNEKLYLRSRRYHTIIQEYDGQSMRNIGSVGGQFAVVEGMKEANGALVVFGSFSSIDSLAANNIALWNGSNWEALGEGLPEAVRDIAPFDGQVCAGWSSTVSCWNGTTWNPIYEGQDDNVLSLISNNADLYVSGIQVDPMNDQKKIARWNGVSLEALDIENQAPTKMAWFKNELVFLNGNQFLRWNGTDLITEGEENPFHPDHTFHPIDDDILSFKVHGDELYIAGRFSSVRGIKVAHVVRWNGTDWLPIDRGGEGVDLGHGAGLPIYSLTSTEDYLFAGGDFFSAGPLIVTGIAAWTGSHWEKLDAFRFTGPRRILDLEIYNDELYFSGRFTRLYDADRTPLWGLAKWDGQQWQPIISTFDTPGGVSNTFIFDMEIFNNTLYVTGTFTKIDDASTTLLAKWDGSTWSPVEHPFVDSQINRMHVHLGNLIVTGILKDAISDSVSYIAAFDGQRWERFEQDLNGPGLALATLGDNLIVGGEFTHAGDKEVNRIALWTGTEWRSFGEGFSAEFPAKVQAITTHGEDIFAAGLFTASGSKKLNSIAKWSGEEWEALGSGIEGGVYALELFDQSLYAAGNFYRAGQKLSSRIARWDLQLVSSSVKDWEFEHSSSALLAANYPNPFIEQTTVPFNIEQPGHVQIDLIDILGRKVKTLAAKHYTPGNYELVIERELLPAGVYFVMLQTGQGQRHYQKVTVAH